MKTANIGIGEKVFVPYYESIYSDEMQAGTVVGFDTDSEDWGFGSKNFPVAVVTLTDGTVENFPIEFVRRA